MHGIVSMPEFDSIDENFNFRDELLRRSTHSKYHACLQHCNYMDKLLANRLNVELEDKDIVSHEAKEIRSTLDDYFMSTKGFKMSWVILSSLVPRLGTNNLNHDSASLIITLVVNNDGSCKKFYTQEKKTKYVLLFLKKDFRPHKLCQ